MKRIFILFVCMASFAAASAQVQFGGKAGLNLSTFAGDDAEGSDMKVGFHVGGLVKVPITESFFFQPELVFSSQGAQTSDDDIDDIKMNLNYLNVPLLAKYQTGSGFFVETGPQIGFLLSAKAKAEGITVDMKDFMKKTDFSWTVGLGFQFPMNFGVNARYNHGLSNIWDEEDSKLNNSVFQVGVFYVIGGSR